MIFTRIKIDNLFCFKDTELDLTYPRKIKDSTVEYEYLDRAENFRFKRLCIISGANASGKSSLSDILLEVINMVYKETYYPLLSELEPSDPSTAATIEVEFVFPTEKKLYFRHLQLILNKGAVAFKYVKVPLLKYDSVEMSRSKIQKVLDGENIYQSLVITNTSDEIDKWQMLYADLSKYREEGKRQVWGFAQSNIYSKTDDANYIDKSNHVYKDVLLAILKTFDPSISRITASYDEESKKITEYTIHFPNQKFCKLDVDGSVDEKYSRLLSMGTYQGITVAGFIQFILKMMEDKTVSGTFFLDEKMSYSHSEIEKAIVNLIVQKINRYSQFFYTTHNYDILEMDFPLHSFVFLKKENEVSQFIWADEVCNKNDRNILPFVKANYFSTIPDTHLLDDLLWQE